MKSEYLVGLLGDGIAHSLTPAMHIAEAAHHGISWDYRLIDSRTTPLPDDIDQVLSGIQAAGYDAINVTHPFKRDVLAHVDELSPDAQQIGAVNLVVFRAGRRIGFNTDWIGFQLACRSGLKGAPMTSVLQVGAGGAGAATAYALLRSGTERLFVHDVDQARATELTQQLQSTFSSQRVETLGVDAAARAATEVDGVVNATPIGMDHLPGTAFDPATTREEAWIADVVYRPLHTELLQEAEQLGRRVLDGSRMAVGQATESLKLISGIEPDHERVRAHCLDLLDREARGILDVDAYAKPSSASAEARAGQ